MSWETLFRDERELIEFYIEEECKEKKDMTRLFGWELPPGVTLNDIEEAMGVDREMTDEEAQRFDALMQEDSEHTRNGYGAEEDPFLPSGFFPGLTGKPYELGETPLTEEEAQEVIAEMRLVVFGVEQGERHDTVSSTPA